MDGFNLHPANNRFFSAVLACAVLAAASSSHAGYAEQAKRIYDRLAGVPPTQSNLNRMQLALQSNAGCGIAASELGNPAALSGVSPCTPLGAAYLAMSEKSFYNATLKNWVTPWTNRDGNKFAPLNDYTATVVGVVRDGVDYRRILFDDIIYLPNPSYGTYSKFSNDLYETFEANDRDMSYRYGVADQSQDLVVAPQSSKSGLASNAVAGVVTTRAAARAFFIDGTNRAMFRFTLKNHLCMDMEDVMDTSRPADRIRRDVSRSPGGDSRIFMNTCVGCHSGMDPMAQAFAFYNWHYDKGSEDAGYLTYRAAADTAHDPGDMSKSATPGGTESKYHINEDHFPEGYETENDKWDNYWRSGPNTALFGWAAGSGTGFGAQTMLQEFANSEAFAVCSVKKVFKVVCLREPGSVNGDQAAFTSMLSNFKSNHYNLKHTFAEAALYCDGH